jgi:NAD(P)-dependent dehydrogenase (short-subunit alcohol dehydrogenase family)
MDVRIDGQVAIVTGAASGMGLATTNALAEAGARVLAADVNQERLEAAFAGATAILPHHVDLQDADAVTAMVDKAVEAFETVDILVNNAGVMDVYQGVATLDLGIWRRMFAINVDAPMHAMRRAVPIMLARGKGTIVNILSTAAGSGAAAGAAYTASKHALLGLSRSTAWTYADRGIRCNAILPGGTRTNVRESMIGEVDEAGRARARLYQQCIPAEMLPEDIAALVLMLVSDAAVRINGAEIAADGGWLAA